MVVLFQSPGIWCAESFYPLCCKCYLFRCHFHFRSAITSHLSLDSPLLLCVLLVFFLLFLLVQFRFLLSFCATAVPKPMYNICSKCIAMGSLPSLPLHNPPPGPVERKEWSIHRGGEEGGHSQTDTPLHHNTFSLTSFQRFRSEHGPYRLVEYLL